MLINIKNMEAKNFLSYENLNISFDRGVHVVGGWNEDASTSNGSGKSSIFDALTWCLYGYTVRNIKNGEMTRSGQDVMEVMVNIENDLGVKYKIHRCTKPNTLKLWQNDEEVLMENKVALQGHISKHVLSMPYDVFIKTIYFPQGYQMRFLTLSEEERKDILFKIIKLDYFDHIYNEIASDLKISAADYINKKNNLIDKIKDAKSSKEMMVEYKKKLDHFAQEKANDLRLMDEELSDIENEIKEFRDKEADLKTKLITNPEYVKELVAKLEVCTAELDKMAKLRDKKAGMQQALKSLFNEESRLNNEFKNITSSNAPCPYCSRTLDTSFVKTKQVSVNLNIKDNRKKIDDLESSINKINIYLSENFDKTQKLKEETLVSLSGETKFDREIEQMASFQSSLFDRMKLLQARRGKLMSSPNVYVELMEDQKMKIQALMLDIKAGHDEISMFKNKIYSLGQLKTIFGPNGVKAIILDGIVNEINQIIKDYLGILYEQSFDIKFDIKSNVTPVKGTSYKITSDFTIDGKEWPFNALSGGEKRRAILAVDLAISKIMSKRYGTGCNLMILDEVTTDLDVYSRKKFYDLVQYINEDKSMYLIDHASEVKDVRDSISLWVNKVNGISTLTEIKSEYDG